ncbi:hypothetical protein MIND_00649100 [Mycena indigotica]|uniref:F-box domain-containing protein n=1 Tax=Mycena indigotica TaxID=2126181 RepID=A0A8H6W621_9AGAR|nr:uncharacterized protein MIND_00649100 [Mycena indigotica]KAF7304171.1 hypothetical protein MIND_00649100 [Mycena indigotica]
MVNLPLELWDAVLDHLHDQPTTLLGTAAVCRAWVPASRFHGFSALSLSIIQPHKSPEAAALRALQLDVLLASPHETLSASVNTLSVRDTLAPVRLRPDPTRTTFVTVTLLQLAPRVALLPHITCLALTELCWPFLRALGPHVEHLSLASGAVCLGPNVPRLCAALPRLKTLALDGVAGIPFRPAAARATGNLASAAVPSLLQSLTIRRSSIAFLPWLTLVGMDNLRSLHVEDLVSYELDCLTGFLVAAPILENLELTFFTSCVDDNALTLVLAPRTCLKTVRVRGSDVLPHAKDSNEAESKARRESYHSVARVF